MTLPRGHAEQADGSIGQVLRTTDTDHTQEVRLTTLRQQIRAGCTSLRLDVGADSVEQLAAFIGLLGKWNRVYNLTAVRDPHAAVTRHILDSLAVLPFLTHGRLLDVGTGAGLPGLPIAIARPGLSVTLLDVSGKKLRFVRQAVVELGLGNVEVVQMRVQEYQPAHAFDMVISRALASLYEVHRDSARLLRPGGRLLFMKGSLPAEEIRELESGQETLHIERLHIPGLTAQRHLLWMEQTLESSTKP